MGKRKSSHRSKQPQGQQTSNSSRSIQFQYNGPIPPPNMLQQYDDILPGAAERILRMAEEQSAHRKELEKKVIEGDDKRASRGQVFGFIIALVVITAGFVLMFTGKETLGISSIVTALSSLVLVFITGSLTRSRERKRKM